jgi:hypothetical protein
MKIVMKKYEIEATEKQAEALKILGLNPIEIESSSKAQVVSTCKNTVYQKTPKESWLMSYEGPHKEFFQELIVKINETYKGTKAEIPTGTSGEVQSNLIKRMGIISTIANDSSLRSHGMLPINPVQSEYLLKNGKLTNPTENWEELGMVLYDLKGANEKEAKALMESISKNRDALGLNESDLEKRLLIFNAGAELNSDSNYGVTPIIIPEITQVYHHEILDKTGKNHIFDYALEKGLPDVSETGTGSRTLYMPSGSKIGLRSLCRYWDLCLGAGVGGLANLSSDGRVNFARRFEKFKDYLNLKISFIRASYTSFLAIRVNLWPIILTSQQT